MSEDGLDTQARVIGERHGQIPNGVGCLCGHFAYPCCYEATIDSLTRLEEMRKQLDYSKRDGMSIEDVARIGLDLVGILEAVLAIPRTRDKHQDLLYRIGYNHNREEIHAVVETKLKAGKKV